MVSTVLRSQVALAVLLPVVGLKQTALPAMVYMLAITLPAEIRLGCTPAPHPQTAMVSTLHQEEITLLATWGWAPRAPTQSSQSLVTQLSQAMSDSQDSLPPVQYSSPTTQAVHWQPTQLALSTPSQLLHGPLLHQHSSLIRTHSLVQISSPAHFDSLMSP